MFGIGRARVHVLKGLYAPGYVVASLNRGAYSLQFLLGTSSDVGEIKFLTVLGTYLNDRSLPLQALPITEEFGSGFQVFDFIGPCFTPFQFDIKQCADPPKLLRYLIVEGLPDGVVTYLAVQSRLQLSANSLWNYVFNCQRSRLSTYKAMGLQWYLSSCITPSSLAGKANQ